MTIHVNDIGTEFRIKFVKGSSARDISSATVKQIRFLKPDGTVMDRDADFITDGTDGLMRYIIQAGELDQVGRWWYQPYLEMPAWSGYVGKKVFLVETNLPTT